MELNGENIWSAKSLNMNVKSKTVVGGDGNCVLFFTMLY